MDVHEDEAWQFDKGDDEGAKCHGADVMQDETAGCLADHTTQLLLVSVNTNIQRKIH